jgi:hypothetical protein
MAEFRRTRGDLGTKTSEAKGLIHRTARGMVCEKPRKIVILVKKTYCMLDSRMSVEILIVVRDLNIRNVVTREDALLCVLWLEFLTMGIS